MHLYKNNGWILIRTMGIIAFYLALFLASTSPSSAVAMKINIPYHGEPTVWYPEDNYFGNN
jgi:hypothetical protein